MSVSKKKKKKKKRKGVRKEERQEINIENRWEGAGRLEEKLKERKGGKKNERFHSNLIVTLSKNKRKNLPLRTVHQSTYDTIYPLNTMIHKLIRRACIVTFRITGLFTFADCLSICTKQKQKNPYSVNTFFVGFPD